MNSLTDRPHPEARGIILVGVLLQSLHILFGITGIIAALVAMTNGERTEGTLYESHRRWQIMTFWVGLGGYAIALWLWSAYDYSWPLIVVFSYIMYRVLTSLVYWLSEQPLNRFT